MPVAAALAVALLLAGCAGEGDFGRPQPSVVTDTYLAFAGNVVAKQRGEPASTFMLTDDEKELRDRAWRFLTPALPQAQFQGILASLRISRVLPSSAMPPKPEDYFATLMSIGWRSSVPPYRRMRDDIAADARLLDPYFAVLDRVARTDAIRARALAAMPEVSSADREDAQARIAENRALAWWVETALAARIAGYRYALRHLVIEIPEREAVGVERALADLEARAGIRPLAYAK